jgi:hypothetical protein
LATCSTVCPGLNSHSFPLIVTFGIGRKDSSGRGFPARGSALLPGPAVTPVPASILLQLANSRLLGKLGVTRTPA